MRVRCLAGLLCASAITATTVCTATDAATPAAGGLSVITEPQARVTPLLSAVRDARHSVQLVMYELEDPKVETALIGDERRGVAVRVLLNRGYYGESSGANQAAYDDLRAHSVPVRWTPSFFALTHEKALVVDDRAFILTLNLTPRYYATDRDFAILDPQPADVSAIRTTFDDDWAGRRATPPTGRDLVWSPGAESRLLGLINSATGTLDVENEEMDDTTVEHALEAAARRGVHVRVVMTDSSEWRSAFTQLTRAGVKVRTYSEDAPLYIHAKLLLTGDRFFVGSQNFSSTSLERNRELGIIASDPRVAGSLAQTFDDDFDGARPF